MGQDEMQIKETMKWLKSVAFWQWVLLAIGLIVFGLAIWINELRVSAGLEIALCQCCCLEGAVR